MKIKEIKLNEYITYKDRIFRVEESKFNNGKMQGHRVILKLLTRDELHKLFLKNIKKR